MKKRIKSIFIFISSMSILFCLYFTMHTEDEYISFESFSDSYMEMMAKSKPYEKKIILDKTDLFIKDETYMIDSTTFSDSTNSEFTLDEHSLTITKDDKTFFLQENKNTIYFDKDNIEVMPENLMIHKGKYCFPVERVAEVLGYTVSVQTESIVLTTPFSSCRLIVKSKAELDKQGAIAFAEGFDDLHIFAYKTEYETEQAFQYYDHLSVVEYVEPDRLVFVDDVKEETISTAGIEDSFSYTSWGAQAMGVGGYSNYLLSRKDSSELPEIIVAVLDTGIDTDHSWFNNRISSGGKNYTTSTSTGYAYEDSNGHGTHVSGIITDLTLSNVKILPIKIIGDDGEGSTSSVINGINYAISLKQQGKNIKVMNLSFGTEVTPTSLGYKTLNQYITNAYNAGIISVAAAGNGDENGIGIDAKNTAPANIECAITVSAVSQNGNSYSRTAFSNYGDTIDVCAPGYQITSAYVGGGTASLSGTSMATPHISAALALLYSDDIAAYSISEVETVLKESVLDLGDTGWDKYYGYGFVNLKYAYSTLIDDVSFHSLLEYTGTELKLTLSHEISKACIYYTLDGTIPSNTNGILYTAPLVIEEPTLIKTIAYLTYGSYIGSSGVTSHYFSFEETFLDEMKVDENTALITVICNGDGMITPAGNQLIEFGTDITFDFIPEEGNVIQNVKVDGKSQGAVNTYVLYDIRKNHQIEVEFEISHYSISIDCGDYGTSAFAGENSVEYGSDFTVEFIPNPGYHIDSIFVDGIQISETEMRSVIDNSYTLTHITNDHEINVIFEINLYTIEVIQTEHGTISSAQSRYEYASSESFSITADMGYHISHLLIDGILYREALDAYTFTTIENNHTISAVFEPNTDTSYMVRHYQQSLTPTNVNWMDKYYSLYEVSNQTGITNTTSLTEANTYSGFTALFTEEKNIDPDGSTIVNIYYDRNSYEVSLVYEDGVTSASGAGTYLFGQSVTIDAVLAEEYNWKYWESTDENSISSSKSKEYSFIMPANSIEFRAKATSAKQYNITVLQPENGTISPYGSHVVDEGTDFELILSPCIGYKVKTIKVDGENVGTLNHYTLSNIEANHIIEAEFEKITYTISIVCGANGSSNLTGNQVVEYNSNLFLFFTPNEGYVVKDVKVDGESKGVLSSYTFVNIDSNHQIEITFEILKFYVTVYCNSNGRVSPSGKTYISYGSDFDLTITPNSGYAVSYIAINGIRVETKNNIKLQKITSNQEIIVIFEQVFSITAESSDHGTITPSCSVMRDGQAQFDFIANPGYKVKDVLVDGVSVGAVDSYTFLNVEKSHDIYVLFEIQAFAISVQVEGLGKVSTSKDLTNIKYHEDCTLSLKPEESWSIQAVYVNGKLEDISGDVLSINNIEENVDVFIIFTQDKADTSSNWVIIVLSVIASMAFVCMVLFLILLLKARKKLR